ncbi:hypothetical protein [aff. Roholtiella sp. LEGE 12411]|nr:hypothetical protein [aff. Roholtiella sp. LEGE 12411]
MARKTLSVNQKVFLQRAIANKAYVLLNRCWPFYLKPCSANIK